MNIACALAFIGAIALYIAQGYFDQHQSGWLIVAATLAFLNLNSGECKCKSADGKGE